MTRSIKFTEASGRRPVTIGGSGFAYPLIPMKFTGLSFCLLLSLLFVVALPASARSADQVDLELVLAVDVSHSMDRTEQRLQRDGYVHALRHRDVVRAIKSGPNGRIAIAYMEWGDPGFQSIVLPWRIIGSQQDADKVATELARQPIGLARRTSISAALRVAAHMIARNGISSLRQVIDVSGDGPNNIGEPVADARADIIGQGIVINGLPFIVKRPHQISSFFSVPDIDRYYEDCVIGGNGAFSIPVSNQQEFTTAVRRKLINEIAAYPPTPRLLRRIQFNSAPKTHARTYDCLAGEKLWDAFQKE